MEQKLTNELTSYAAASLAKILVLPEEEKESTEASQASSMSLFEFAGILDPTISSSKTRRSSLLGDSIPFSEKLPKSGTMRNGVLYQREPLAPLINATGGGAFVNVPTPTVGGNYNRKGASKKSGDGLETWVKKHISPPPQELRQ